MRGMNPNTLQSMFQANHMGKAGLYDNQGGKMKKKQPMMLHSDPSILGMRPQELLRFFLITSSPRTWTALPKSVFLWF